MGQDKALLSVEGEAMALRVAGALREAGAAEVVGIGGDAEALGRLGLRVIADDHPGEGPFPATLTALRHAPSEVVAVLSCDLLRPSAVAVTALVRALMEGEALGAVPVVDGHHQWTHAVWRRAGARAAPGVLRSGRPLAPTGRDRPGVVRGRRHRWPVGRRCGHPVRSGACLPRMTGWHG